VAITVTFNYCSTHAIRNVNGLVSAVPALPAQSRLYVIHNATTNRPVYVGTANNVQNRFGCRLEASRELGFGNDELTPITVMVVQILVGGVASTPGDSGISSNIDVEALLIRTYLQHLQWNVRNIQKVTPFTNGTGTVLQWSLVNGCGIANFGGHYTYQLAAGAVL
jgi:hypothetical protein